MRISLSLLLALVLSLPAQAAKVVDGHETQNGGGAAEQSFTYALAVIKPVTQMCLTTNCVRDPRHREILAAIVKNLDVELAQPALLRFESGKENPARFQVDGAVRVAVTGLTPGATIFVNQDSLYRQTAEGVLPFGVSEALGVLVHELGHHQGERDHDLLDALAGRVRAFFDLRQDRLTLDLLGGFIYESNVTLSVFHTRDTSAPFAHHSYLWLSVDDENFDLNGEVRSRLSCPMAAPGQPSVLEGYRFTNLGWGEGFRTTGADTVTFPLEGIVWIECRLTNSDGRPVFLANKYRVVIDLGFKGKRRSSAGTYVPGSLKLSLTQP